MYSSFWLFDVISFQGLLDNHLVKSNTDSEAMSREDSEKAVFYLKMKGDYHRYMTEYSVDPERGGTVALAPLWFDVLLLIPFC